MKPHQLASAKFHAKRKDAGWKKVTVWLDSDSLVKLDALRDQEGSLDKAVAYAVRMSPARADLQDYPGVIIHEDVSIEIRLEEPK